MKDLIGEIFENPEKLALIKKYFKERDIEFEKNKHFLMSDKFIEIDNKINDLMLSEKLEKRICIDNIDEKLIKKEDITKFINAALVMERKKEKNQMFPTEYVETEYLIISVIYGQGTLIEIRLKN